MNQQSMGDEDGDVDVTARLAALEQRLARIEGVLGLVDVPRKEKTPSPAEPAMPRPVPPPLPVIPIQEKMLEPESQPIVEYAPQPSPAPIPVRGDFEQTIGLKWAGWVGAVVLVIGTAFGIKFAVDQGWLGHVPKEARLILMYIGGFLILVAGEVVYRRINVVSAAAVYGAGVATLFVVS